MSTQSARQWGKVLQMAQIPRITMTLRMSKQTYSGTSRSNLR